MKLQTKLHSLDMPSFNYLQNFDIDMDELFKGFLIGARRYLLKESDDTMDRAKRVFKL